MWRILGDRKGLLHSFSHVYHSFSITNEKGFQAISDELLWSTSTACSQYCRKQSLHSTKKSGIKNRFMGQHACESNCSSCSNKSRSHTKSLYCRLFRFSYRKTSIQMMRHPIVEEGGAAKHQNHALNAKGRTGSTFRRGFGRETRFKLLKEDKSSLGSSTSMYPWLPGDILAIRSASFNIHGKLLSPVAKGMDPKANLLDLKTRKVESIMLEYHHGISKLSLHFANLSWFILIPDHTFWIFLRRGMPLQHLSVLRARRRHHYLGHTDTGSDCLPITRTTKIHKVVIKCFGEILTNVYPVWKWL